MKTKKQKAEELKKGEDLLKKSAAVLFIDFSKVRTADLRNLRNELKKNGSPLFIMKKRILGLMLKDKGVNLQDPDFKTSVGAVFASDLESASASIYKFFKQLEKDKKVDSLKMLGGYNVKTGTVIPKQEFVFIGQLPPREILLAQLLGMLAAPIRSFLYVLSEKSKQTA